MKRKTPECCSAERPASLECCSAERPATLVAYTGNHTFQVPNLKSIMLNLAFLLVLRHMYSMGNYNTYVGMFKAVRLCVKAQRLRKLQKFGIDYSWNRYGSTHSKTIAADCFEVVSTIRLNDEATDPTSAVHSKILSKAAKFQMYTPAASVLCAFCTADFATALDKVLPQDFGHRVLRQAVQSVLSGGTANFLNAHFQSPQLHQVAKLRGRALKDALLKIGHNALNVASFKETDRKRDVLVALLKRGTLTGKNIFQVIKRHLKQSRTRWPRAWSQTSREEPEKHLLITGPGARKFINSWHANPRLFAHRASGEAEMEMFSQWAKPVYAGLRQALEEISECTTGAVQKSALQLLDGDIWDAQFHMCELTKVLQQLYNGNKKYLRSSDLDASGEIESDSECDP